jgi:hypothetical protein
MRRLGEQTEIEEASAATQVTFVGPLRFCLQKVYLVRVPYG